MERLHGKQFWARSSNVGNHVEHARTEIMLCRSHWNHAMQIALKSCYADRTEIMLCRSHWNHAMQIALKSCYADRTEIAMQIALKSYYADRASRRKGSSWAARFFVEGGRRPALLHHGVQVIKDLKHWSGSPPKKSLSHCPLLFPEKWPVIPSLLFSKKRPVVLPLLFPDKQTSATHISFNKVGLPSWVQHKNCTSA